MQKSGISVLPAILSVVLLFAIAVVFVFAAGGYRENRRSREVDDIQTAVMHTLVQCYALEGSYPPDLDYLKEHYGLILDRTRYIFHYDIIGANVMPVVHVLPRHDTGAER